MNCLFIVNMLFSLRVLYQSSSPCGSYRSGRVRLSRKRKETRSQLAVTLWVFFLFLFLLFNIKLFLSNVLGFVFSHFINILVNEHPFAWTPAHSAAVSSMPFKFTSAQQHLLPFRLELQHNTDNPNIQRDFK